MPSDDTSRLRATDLDRTEVCALLDRAYAEGQLDNAEHDVRLSVATSSKTRGELLSLLDDLQVERPDFASGNGSGYPGGGGASDEVARRSDALIPSRSPATVLIVVVTTVVVLVLVGVAAALLASRDSGGSDGSDGVPGPAPEVVVPGDADGAGADDAGADDSADEAGDAVADAVPAEDAGGAEEVPGDTTPKISVYEMETTIRGDYLNSQGHIPEYVTCPDALDATVGAAVECSVGDHGAVFPATVTVIGAQDSTVTYNVNISGVW